jgi:hypothetical protein
MSNKRNDDDYKLKLTGAGVSIERPVDEIIARQIMALVMGGSASGGESPAVRSGFNPGSTPTDTSTPKAFMSGKRPTTDMERVTCLAYFLTHYRNTSAFKTKDLTDLNIEAAQPKLSNASATARNAVASGFLALAGSGRKQITPRGEAMVVALPDRDKAKAALEDHKIRKPRKKRARKAK